jgi:hypothetical protein
MAIENLKNNLILELLVFEYNVFLAIKERQMWVGRKDFMSLSDFGSVHTGFGRDSMREFPKVHNASKHTGRER